MKSTRSISSKSFKKLNLWLFRPISYLSKSKNFIWDVVGQSHLHSKYGKKLALQRRERLNGSYTLWTIEFQYKNILGPSLYFCPNNPLTKHLITEETKFFPSSKIYKNLSLHKFILKQFLSFLKFSKEWFQESICIFLHFFQSLQVINFEKQIVLPLEDAVWLMS